MITLKIRIKERPDGTVNVEAEATAKSATLPESKISRALNTAFKMTVGGTVTKEFSSEKPKQTATKFGPTEILVASAPVE
jgi:hypothetical protein